MVTFAQQSIIATCMFVCFSETVVLRDFLGRRTEGVSFVPKMTNPARVYCVLTYRGAWYSPWGKQPPSMEAPILSCRCLSPYIIYADNVTRAH